MESQSVTCNESKEMKEALELGYIICKRCGAIIDTLPTNRVKRFYGECAEECEDKNEGGREFD
ncbi:GapA-binding peptide SR1P [Paenibacillus solisilvae]|uniref:GapA-binding peptide SR1P n=1 Tax=Paenibacillus solisilvae TaxID=2486751 RepID=A0ABW0VSC9_9BACL